MPQPIFLQTVTEGLENTRQFNTGPGRKQRERKRVPHRRDALSPHMSYKPPCSCLCPHLTLQLLPAGSVLSRPGAHTPEPTQQ